MQFQDNRYLNNLTPDCGVIQRRPWNPSSVERGCRRLVTSDQGFLPLFCDFPECSARSAEVWFYRVKRYLYKCRYFDTVKEMGIFSTECRCGCQQKVGRGSHYFLQQSRGMDLGLELLDALEEKRIFSREFDAELAVLQSLVGDWQVHILRANLTLGRDSLYRSAHGERGDGLTRKNVETLNTSVCLMTYIVEQNFPDLSARIQPLKRLSPSQKMQYRNLARG